MWPLVAGIAGAGLVLALAVKRQAADWKVRAAALERSIRAEGDALEAYMASRGSAIEHELQTYGQEYADQLANRTAEHVLGVQYGLTPERLAAIDRLARRFG